MQDVILSPISLGELRALISETLEVQVNRILEEQTKTVFPELLTRKETAKILGVSLVTLNEWQKTGKVPAYRINTRIRYKSAEVLNCLSLLQIKYLGDVA